MTEAAPRIIAVRILIVMYATGDSGVSRSWRLQPAARSIETIAPPLVVARTAPYRAMLIMMKGETLQGLPVPADWLAYALFSPKARNRTTGARTEKITVRRLRSSRRTSSLSTVRLKPPRAGASLVTAAGAGIDWAVIGILLRKCHCHHWSGR